MKTLTINDTDYRKAVRLLADNGIAIESEPEIAIHLLRKSNAKPGQTPASFGGIWANDERTLQSIRVKAWTKRR